MKPIQTQLGGFSLIEVAISMTIASVMILGTVTLALDGAQSQWTASQLSSMTTTASDIMTRLQRDALLASSAVATPTSVTFTMPDATTRSYAIDVNQNLTINGNALNPDTQQVICTGTCFVLTNGMSGVNITSQMLTIQNLRVESRAGTRTALENSMGQSTRYTLPIGRYSISGQRGFL